MAAEDGASPALRTRSHKSATFELNSPKMAVRGQKMMILNHQ
jgi:hypothetical protein